MIVSGESFNKGAVSAKGDPRFIRKMIEIIMTRRIHLSKYDITSSLLILSKTATIMPFHMIIGRDEGILQKE
jgi:hypothetical protein